MLLRTKLKYIILFFSVSFLLWMTVAEREFIILHNYLNHKLKAALPSNVEINSENLTVRLTEEGVMLFIIKPKIIIGGEEIIAIEKLPLRLDLMALLPLVEKSVINVDLSTLMHNLHAKLSHQNWHDLALKIWPSLQQHKHLMQDFELTLHDVLIPYIPSLQTVRNITIQDVTLRPIFKKNMLTLHCIAHIILPNSREPISLDIRVQQNSKQHFIFHSTILNAPLSIGAWLSKDLWWLNDSNITNKLEVDGTLDASGNIEELKIKASDWSGDIANQYLWPDPITITKYNLDLTYTKQQVIVHSLQLGNTEFEINATNIIYQNDAITNAEFNIKPIALSLLKKYWPQGHYKDMYDHLFNNITEGIIENIKCINGVWQLMLGKIYGQLENTDIPWEANAISIQIQPESVLLTADKGNIAGNTITKVIWQKNIAQIFVEGALPDIIKTGKHYINTDVFKNLLGSYQGIIKWNSDNNITADTTLSQVKWEVTPEYTLSSNSAKVQYRDNYWHLNGPIKINNVLANVIWRQHFTSGEEYLEATFPDLTPKKLESLHYTLPFPMFDVMNLNMTVRNPIYADHQGVLSTDLMNTTINIPLFNIYKNKGIKAQASLEYHKQGDKVYVKNYIISMLDTILQGYLIMKGDNIQELSTSKISNVENYQLQYRQQGSIANIVLSGDTFALPKAQNLHALLQEKGQNITITSNLKKIIFNNKWHLSAPHFSSNALEWKLSGNMPEGEALHIQLTKDKGSMNIPHIGELLAALELSTQIRGGVLKGTLQKQENNQWAGTIYINNFHLNKSNAVSKLLGILSLANIGISGLRDLFSNEDIAFDEMLLEINTNDQGIWQLKKAKLEGDSMSIILKGDIDINKQYVNIQGTVFPNGFLNMIIRAIPILGSVLSSEEQPFIGVNFSIKGDMNDPDIYSNPLSIFTPGELRNILQ